MTTIRRIEIISDQLYKEKKIMGFCHLYDGQEGTGAGIAASLTYDDPIISGYRIHGLAYLRGISPYAIFAEMLGK